MPFDYRKPGVYVEESLLVATADTASASSTSFFVGVAGTGPTNGPIRCNTWSDYVMNFGGFDNIQHPDDSSISLRSYLPYAVYCYFQNGGRPAYVQRAVGTDEGARSSLSIRSGEAVVRNINNKALASNVATLTTTAAHGFAAGNTVTISGVGAPYDGVKTITSIGEGTNPTTFSFAATGDDESSTSITSTGKTATLAAPVSFVIESRNIGVYGNSIGITVSYTDEEDGVFNLVVYKDGTEFERFQFLTLSSDIPGTRQLESAVNDPFSGSTLVRISSVSTTNNPNSTGSSPLNLTGGADPGLPTQGDLTTAAINNVPKVEGPIILNLVGYLQTSPSGETYVAPSAISTSGFDRNDIFVINDSIPARSYNQSAVEYKAAITSTLSQNTGNSYVASYAPWIIIADPKRAGATITVPPGGAVAGVISRVDSTVGVFRAPAGVIATITNAVGVDTKFSDADLGDLNTSNINVIRSVPGVGVAIMGARTRKLYGADRYVSARRTLIYLKETLKRSTEFALFENNDQRLWTQLYMAADRILRPLWESGGLRGANASEAYFIRCDSSINTASVIASGEVRMEVGVALEYPAEFIVIKVTQYESGGFSAEVQPQG